jgi:hypothetical protein
MPLPMGLVYDEQGQVVLDPDQQVQQAIRLFFETFRRTGAASAVVRAFRRDGIRFPRRPMDDPPEWGPCDRSGQTCTTPGTGPFLRSHEESSKPGGGPLQKLQREHWHTLLVGAHAGTSPGRTSTTRGNSENAQAYGASQMSSARRDRTAAGARDLRGLSHDGPYHVPAHA